MTNIVSVSEAKQYMRIDYSEEDMTIESLLNTAQVLCRDVARLSFEDWENIAGLSDTELHSQLKTAVLYTVSYLFEHREEADHHELTLTLRSLLFGIREAVL